MDKNAQPPGLLLGPGGEAAVKFLGESLVVMRIKEGPTLGGVERVSCLVRMAGAMPKERVSELADSFTWPSKDVVLGWQSRVIRQHRIYRSARHHML